SGSDGSFKRYKKASETPAWDYIYDLMINANISDSAYEYMIELAGGEVEPEMAQPDASYYKDHKLNIIDGNTAELDLGYEAASMLSSVSYSLSVHDEEAMVYLGTNNNITEDWENGVFRDDFDGSWGTLNGNFVYMEMTNSEDGYNIYAIPIKLNGTECVLQVGYDTETETGVIMGVSSEIEDGMARKDLRKIAVGDEITTMAAGVELETLETEMFDLDTFTVDENTAFAMDYLSDANYAIQFEMKTINNEVYSSDTELFTVEDGVMFYR
ncbi:MAG: hypothetical protein J6P16_04370, partial [Eubacterium sp.]|nr:hypothetical protein [Eubacterium sp.]